MKKLETICYSLITLIIVIGAVVAITSPDFFDNQLTVEDGIYEWLTVIMLFITGCVMIRRAFLRTGNSSMGQGA